MSSERKPPDDHELEDFLAGKHPVGRAYRDVSAHETAPRELDDAILRMAREHAAPKPQAVAPIRRRPRWLQPLAVAATLALSLGVLMNIWRDPSMREQAAPAEETGSVEISPPPSPTPQPEPAPAAEAPIVEPARPDADRALESREKRALPSPPPATEARRAQPFPQERALRAEPERHEALADSVSPSDVGPRAGSTMAPTAPPPPPPPAPAASAPSAGAAPASRPEIAPRLSFEKVEQERKALAAEAQAQSSRDASDTPEMMIERARAAIARGDQEEAHRVVAELRRRFPDAALPEDLRPLASPTP